MSKFWQLLPDICSCKLAVVLGKQFLSSEHLISFQIFWPTPLTLKQKENLKYYSFGIVSNVTALFIPNPNHFNYHQIEILFNYVWKAFIPVYGPHSPSNVRNFIKQTFNLLIELSPSSPQFVCHNRFNIRGWAPALHQSLTFFTIFLYRRIL